MKDFISIGTRVILVALNGAFALHGTGNRLADVFSAFAAGFILYSLILGAWRYR